MVLQKMRDFVMLVADVVVDGMSQEMSRNVVPEVEWQKNWGM